MNSITNKLAVFLYTQWFDQKVYTGYHLPEKCPTVENNNNDDENANKDLIHCSKCCSELCGFEKLDTSMRDEYIAKALVMEKKLSESGLIISEK
ncbi:MAG: hypothetical protein A2015_17500 [Spirochaetes bacterium GWF1_31_7]|nr:MAG: hypothetical protein A2Y30_05490 [Spirochaetes bacterium GWE1_32_154]OHD46249.1 MAG: hypothetical protein A2Y29_08495 [Spirochaetes bacterium GWE2_31_10]OHD48619.1 MAG: hypothetical protein A2015_17500 [Spirochaetes bacterium GWF1_31_7]OHD74411.1 MAG: hypothetical protein A2355_03075 [Spirochaetes bacterium RIFOXYB1_FULL_32_8]HBD93065.1 hypothetical protein [Spirochaetia bacterium]